MWFKKKSNDKVETENNKSTTEITKPETIEVPTPVENRIDYNGKIEDHNDFNVIVDFERTKFRIKSSTSHEIVRLNCVTKEYEFNYISSTSGDTYHCVKKITITPYVKRLFITDSGRFFYQVIYCNNDVKYCPINRESIHKSMSVWESTDRMSKPISHDDSSYNGHWVVLPGKHDRSKITCSGPYTWNWASFIETYDIVDQKLYDTKLIEVF